jgi:hypothetical protein
MANHEEREFRLRPAESVRRESLILSAKCG